jgi:hypothetical protein
LGIEDYDPSPPFKFVGMAEADDETLALNPQLRGTLEPRFLDANDHSASILDVYRATMATENLDACAVPVIDHMDDVQQQIAEAGWRQEPDGYETLVWVQVSPTR